MRQLRFHVSGKARSAHLFLMRWSSLYAGSSSGLMPMRTLRAARRAEGRSERSVPGTTQSKRTFQNRPPFSESASAIGTIGTLSDPAPFMCSGRSASEATKVRALARGVEGRAGRKIVQSPSGRPVSASCRRPCRAGHS